MIVLFWQFFASANDRNAISDRSISITNAKYTFFVKNNSDHHPYAQLATNKFDITWLENPQLVIVNTWLDAGKIEARYRLENSIWYLESAAFRKLLPQWLSNFSQDRKMTDDELFTTQYQAACGNRPCKSKADPLREICKISAKQNADNLMNKTCDSANLEFKKRINLAIHNPFDKKMPYLECIKKNLNVGKSWDNILGKMEATQDQIRQNPEGVIGCRVENQRACAEFKPTSAKGLNKFEILFAINRAACKEALSEVESVSELYYHELLHSAIFALGAESPITDTQLDEFEARRKKNPNACNDLAKTEVFMPSHATEDAAVKSLNQATTQAAKTAGLNSFNLGAPVAGSNLASQPWLPSREQIAELTRPATTVADLPNQQVRREKLASLIDASIKSIQPRVEALTRIVESPAFAKQISLAQANLRSPTTPGLGSADEASGASQGISRKPSSATPATSSGADGSAITGSGSANLNASSSAPTSRTRSSNKIAPTNIDALITTTPADKLAKMLNMDRPLTEQIVAKGYKLILPTYTIKPNQVQKTFVYNPKTNRMELKND